MLELRDGMSRMGCQGWDVKDGMSRMGWEDGEGWDVTDGMGRWGRAGKAGE
jgi:hypothetical protein